MPHVGDKTFGYDAAGKKKAANYAKKTGQPMKTTKSMPVTPMPARPAKPMGPPTFIVGLGLEKPKRKK